MNDASQSAFELFDFFIKIFAPIIYLDYVIYAFVPESLNFSILISDSFSLRYMFTTIKSLLPFLYLSHAI